MKERKHIGRMILLGLTALALTVGVVAASGAGTQADPLITLSYLDQTALPAVVEQVAGQATSYQEELVGKLDQLIQQYTAKMEELVGTKPMPQQAATYTVVTLKKDQLLKMDIGCEAMLRIGTAQCVSPSDPGLINTTTGATISNGKALEVNHLYMATIAGRSIKATANTTKVLIRGGYTIE